MRSIQAAHFLCAFLASGVGANVVPALAEDRRPPSWRRSRRRSSRSVSAPRPRRFATALATELAGLPGPSAPRSTASTRRATTRRSGPSRAATAAAELVAALEAAAGDQALPAGALRRRGPAMLFDADATGTGRPQEVAATRAYLRLRQRPVGGRARRRRRSTPSISRKPVRPAPAALLLAPLDTAPLAGGAAGLEPADPDYRRLIAEKRAARRHGADRELGPGGAGRPDAASRARPARGWPSCAPGWRGSATSRRAARRSTRRFDPALEAAVETFQARLRPRRRRRGRRRDARGGQRAGRDPAGAGGGQPRADALDGPRPRRALPLRQHPRLHRAARRRTARTTWQSKVVVGKTHVTETAGVLRRGQLHGRQPDLAHPRLHRDPRLPAEAAARPDGAEAAEHPAADPRRHRDQPEARRLHPVHARELPVPHQAAAERRQRARQGQVHVPERALDLPARHAAPRAISRATCAPSRTAASGWRSRSSSRTSC